MILFSFSLHTKIISPSGLLISTDTDAKIVYTFTPEGILLKDGEILISGKEYQASLYLEPHILLIIRQQV